MSEPAQAGKTCDLRGIREAVCVHTGKITDSCLAKDCIEDLRVYLTVDSQHTLDCAASAKARFVELLFVDVQVECVPYSSGYFTVDVTFYYRVIADATLSAGQRGSNHETNNDRCYWLRCNRAGLCSEYPPLLSETPAGGVYRHGHGESTGFRRKI